MLASNMNDSIPAWKVPLLERRRQQAEFERQSLVDDSARLAQMPAWKREVYLKKRSQKKDDDISSDNTNIRAEQLARKPAFRNPRGKSTNEVIPNREHSRTRDSSEPELTSDSELSDSERLLPIQRNPILQSDLQRRPQTVQNHATSTRHVDQPPKEFQTVCNGNGYSTSGESDRSRPSGKKQDTRNRLSLNEQEQEEVTYGRGFVNKLLGRFRELSENNRTRINTSSVPKRYRSSENLLNDSMYDEGRAKSPSARGSFKFAKGKAQSMENLTTWNMEEKISESSLHRGKSFAVTNGFTASMTPSNIRNGEHTGRKTTMVTMVSKNREPVDMSRSREPVDVSKSREPVDVSRSRQPVDVSRSRDVSKNREPVNVSKSRELVDVSKSRDVSKNRDPVNMSRSREPVNPSKSREPVDVSRSRDVSKNRDPVNVSRIRESIDMSENRRPKNVSKSREPVDMSRSREPVNVSKSREPVDVSRIREPADMSKSREPVDASRIREPVDASRIREPADTSRSREPVDVSRIREPAYASIIREPADVSRSREPANDGLKGSAAVSLTSSSEVVRETSPRPEDELPRSNIVLLTRTVFESIGTSPPIDPSVSRKRWTLPTPSKSYDPRASPWEPETSPDAPDGHVSSGILASTQSNNGSRTASNVADLRVPDVRTASLDRKSRGFEANNATKTSSRDSNQDSASSFASEKFSGSRNAIGSRESLVDSSPVDPTAPVFSGSYEKSIENGRNGLIQLKSGQSQVVQTQSRNGESDSVFADSHTKSETPRQHLILDLKDLPVLAQTPVQRNNRNSMENQSIVDGKNKKKGPGSLLIRPASNLLASSTKVEYLNLTKYNDVKTGDFAPPKKRPLYYDDDDADYGVPVTNLDSVMGDDEDAQFSPKEGDPSVYKSHTPTFEFEGAGVRFGKSLLVKSKDSKKMRIRFDDAAEKTFEYPSEQSMIEEWVDEDDEDEDQLIEPGSSLKNTPGIGSNGSLSSYKSRHQVDYEIGLERPNDVIRHQVTPSSPSSAEVDDTTLMSDDTATWSNSTSSDLLF